MLAGIPITEEVNGYANGPPNSRFHILIANQIPENEKL